MTVDTLIIQYNAAIRKEGGTLSVTEKEKKKEKKDWSWGIPGSGFHPQIRGKNTRIALSISIFSKMTISISIFFKSVDILTINIRYCTRHAPDDSPDMHDIMLQTCPR